ncbi:fasciclin-like arabinogalactan protein 14 [Salvia miltiorrhiza]|uniref:fasciclin-like arabinogalactan protein 14 n=1 Tax=Salvia miltiorrhiza TaxID=226208 RepID=UPI0025AD2A82|nr:fasciclin-like arabinogalactan protein 14 [Salvia miltiorrhiza]
MTLPLSLLFSLLLSLHTANAFDITQLLNQYPDFATFNSYLTQTNLAADINARNTITVLVLDNGSLSPLAGKPVDHIRSILAVHVLLDYYDAPRLQTQAASRNLITTLFQTTGLARGQQGFLSVASPAPGTFAFGSAMPGSPLNSNLVKSVFLQPYNISILQLSGAIIPQGIDGTKTSSPPSTSPPATPIATAIPPATTSLSPPTTPPQSTTPVATATPPATTSLSPPTTPPQSTTPPPTTSANLPTAPPQAQGSSPPVPSMAPPTPTAATVPSMAPPTPSAAAVPSTAPPTPSKAAPLPSTTPPQTSTAPVQSAVPPTSSKAPLPSTVPPVSATPSASPASTIANSPGPAMGPGAKGPVSEGSVSEAGAGEATPSGGKPKSAASPLDSGLAVVFTMVLSALYLASTI